MGGDGQSTVTLRGRYADSAEASPCPSGPGAVYQVGQVGFGREKIPQQQTLTVTAPRGPASLTLSPAAGPGLKGKGVCPGGGGSEGQGYRPANPQVPHL